MEPLRIVLLSVLAAVVYGIAHDLVTAHVCVEYFSVFHPKIIESASPVPLALTWGVVATWWVGLPLGIVLAVGARAGAAPKRSARDLVRPIAVLCAVMAGCSLVAGAAGAILASQGLVRVAGDLATAIPEERHVAFLADLWAHSASYVAGGLGGVVLAVGVWMRRRLGPVS